ncbi:MAG TPA: hypothetical protein PLP23_11035 [Panacibacter sp.]|nr:hypothetical protein [Panacibacter sp.]
MMKIAGTVILYNPDIEVIDNIQSYINAISKLYIVDNSELQVKESLDDILQFPHVVYLHDGENKGIACRLNQVCNLAIQDGYEWLLTMDHDSSFIKKKLDEYFSCINTFEKKENVAMFGLRYYGEQLQEGCIASAVNELITSGSVINLQLYPYVGGFDENLFIDEVDFEYCLNSVTHGYKIIQFQNIFLNHNLGHLSYHRSLKTNKLTPRTLHSPLRIYYGVRNFLYVQSKFKNNFKEDMCIKRKGLMNRIKNNILYNKKRWQVMKYIFKAILDYNNSKMGKL